MTRGRGDIENKSEYGKHFISKMTIEQDSVNCLLFVTLLPIVSGFF